jgi:hypothetical protein
MTPKDFNTWELGLYLNQIRKNNTLKSNDHTELRKETQSSRSTQIAWATNKFPSSYFSEDYSDFLNNFGIKHLGI